MQQRVIDSLRAQLGIPDITDEQIIKATEGTLMLAGTNLRFAFVDLGRAMRKAFPNES